MGQSTWPSPGPSSPLPSYRQLLSTGLSSPFSKSPKAWDDRKEDSEDAEPDFNVTFSQKLGNLLGCFVATYIYIYLLIYSGHLWTVDTIISILLAEYCTWSNEKLRRKGSGEEIQLSGNDNVLSLAEKGDYFTRANSSANCKTDCLAAVVGYREDPVIFEKALHSYLQADGCRFMLVSIDGNGLEDQGMVDVFQKVYPTNSAVLNLSVPYVDLALQMDNNKPTWMSDTTINNKCVAMAKQDLLDNAIYLTGPDAITRLCVTQPHMHKKGVMFTSFILAFAISEIIGIDFIWSSDSDSIVHEDTLRVSTETIAGDERCAGASTALAIHNRNETLVTKLGNTVFLNELHLSRCFSSSVGANDCQSGPCAIFRIKPLRPELIAWYRQEFCGHWMIINEDRHLTTRLLLKGHSVRFITHAITETETPVSLRRWMLQQVRWARSVHIESYARPQVYLVQPPLFCFAALRRQFISFFNFAMIMSYLIRGYAPFATFSFIDFVGRLLFSALYLKVRNPIRPTWEELCWSVPSSLFYNVPLPAVQVWSFITMLYDGWGGAMRGSKEVEEKSAWSRLKKRMWEMGFLVVWAGIVGGIMARWTAYQVGWQEGWQVMICIGLAMSSMWTVFGYWMVTTD